MTYPIESYRESNPLGLMTQNHNEYGANGRPKALILYTRHRPSLRNAF